MSGALAAVLLDKDGTLFAFQETWGPWGARLLRGLATDADHLGRLAGALRFDLPAERFRPDSPAIAGTPDDQVAILLPHLPGWGAEALRAHVAASSAEVAPVPAADLPALVAALRARGLGVGVATNDGIGPARRQLEAAGLGGAFDWVAGCDSGHGAKPAPGMLLAYARHAGLPPGRVAMVGDSTHDLEAARAAGMVGVGVLTGPAGREALAPHAEAVLDGVGDLLAWIDARAGRRAPSPRR